MLVAGAQTQIFHSIEIDASVDQVTDVDDAYQFDRRQSETAED